jgi:hypothetical protein
MTEMGCLKILVWKPGGKEMAWSDWLWIVGWWGLQKIV